jgi:protoporphyrinogen/coproporphyrinogen III oxidase
VLESSPRTGGWLKSSRIERPNGSVLFESGPHTLRPVGLAGLSSLELLRQLDLEPETIWVSNDSIGATKRYIKYDNRLVLLPGKDFPRKLFRTEPFYRKSFGGALKLLLTNFMSSRSNPPGDESIASFFRRRAGQHLTQYAVSAIVHGVYAGDHERLSMRSSFLKMYWEMDRRRRWFRSPKISLSQEEQALGVEMKQNVGVELLRQGSKSTVYSFRDGVETLVQRLRERLEETKVTVLVDTPVQSIKSNDGIQIRTPLRTNTYSHVISAIPLPNLFGVLPEPPSDLVESFPPAVTVAVVNLYYPSSSIILPVHGFGYLIPKRTSPEENPEDALGVIFFSDSIQGQDTGEYQSGVKLTVMMGGHYWRGRTSYPSEDELLYAAKNVVGKDLGIIRDPSLYRVNVQRNCIPQYEVGHWQRVEHLKDYLDSTFGDERFQVVGSAIDDVSVPGCILSGRKAARKLLQLASEEDTQ